MTSPHPEDPTVAETLEEREARLTRLQAEYDAAEKALVVLEKGAQVTSGMTYRRRRFVEEYVVDLNATQAATRAGYGPSSAQLGHMLLKDVEIRAAIDAAVAQRTARVNMAQEHVLNEMALLSHSCVEHYTISDEGQVTPAPGAPDGVIRAIQSIKKRTAVRTDRDGNVIRTYDVELRLWDKPTPLRLMGKHTGLNFSDRVELTGKDGGPIVSRIVREIVDPAAGEEA